RVRWSSTDDAKLVATLTTAKANGLQADSSWKPLVWQQCTDALKDSPDPPKMAKKCQDHWGKSLKKDFKHIRGLCDLSGFNWDDGLKMFTARDAVWDDLLKHHPEHECWRTLPFPFYDEI
ncbi:hypothetical protein K438DRAFT_1480586, partial [Mycena galopus ATCC 62051]